MAALLPLVLLAAVAAQAVDPADGADTALPPADADPEGSLDAPAPLRSPLGGEAPDEMLDEELKEAPEDEPAPSAPAASGLPPEPAGPRDPADLEPTSDDVVSDSDPGPRRPVARVKAKDRRRYEPRSPQTERRAQTRRRQRRPRGAVQQDADAPGLKPIPVPFVVAAQTSVALGVPIVLGCVHYVMTFFTLFTWPLIIYPLAAGYAVTCLGNSLGERQQGALWPMLAALASSCAGWFAVGGLVTTLLVATNGDIFASNQTGPIFSLLILGSLPLPAIGAGLAATAVWALVDTSALPAADSLGTPRMLSEGSDTARLLRQFIGAEILPAPPTRVASAQKY